MMKKMSVYQRAEYVNELAEFAMQIVAFILLFGGGFAVALLWFLGVI